MNDLSDVIVSKVLAAHERKQARERKERIVIGVYIGMTVSAVFALLVLFLLARSYTLNFRMPDLVPYYKMAALVFVLSLISFGIYFIKPRIVRPTL